MNKLFNQNRSNKVQKSAFDLSHEHKLSGKMGTLMPVLCQEVVPGDKFEINSESMIRFAPMVAPIYHRINSYIHYFYVPNRIIWHDWEKFITGAEIALPEIEYTGGYQGSIADCLGLPLPNGLTPEPIKINDLPFRAFFQIYKDYYIDQNLTSSNRITGGAEDELLINRTYDDLSAEHGASFTNSFVTENKFLRAWEKDYFTSALPWAQKGNPVSMQASVISQIPATITYPNGSVPPAGTSAVTMVSSGSTASLVANGNSLTVDSIQRADITVEEMRTATRLQRFLERNARAGTRYVEHLLSHWGVKSSDARLQRAEYIGGGKSPVVVSEVLNTTGTAELPQGNMAGHGINVGRTNHATKFCEEHGFIIGIMSVMPEPNYQNGIPKLWSRKLNLDFYYPEFAQLGEQPVLNKELYWDGETPGNNEVTFGYQSRYAEYKYAPSTVHGHFRDNLDFWHAGRKFAELPTLTQEFIECDTTDINERIFAVNNPLIENLYIQVYHNIKALRPMPFYNTPTL